MAMKRFVDGAEGDFFFQKRAPASKPDWIETVELSFPSGRTASEVVLRDAAQLGIELLAQASGAPVDHFRVRVMEGRHRVLAPPRRDLPRRALRRGGGAGLV